jgi:hypothetical protein
LPVFDVAGVFNSGVYFIVGAFYPPNGTFCNHLNTTITDSLYRPVTTEQLAIGDQGSQVVDYQK